MDLSSSYFELFGLPTGFVIDVAALQPRWRELQRLHHPDRHAQDDAAGQQHALQMAAHINVHTRRCAIPSSARIICCSWPATVLMANAAPSPTPIS